VTPLSLLTMGTWQNLGKAIEGMYLPYADMLLIHYCQLLKKFRRTKVKFA
jgi:hypothetical protein